MNPGIGRLEPYPFERLARLTQGIAPPTGLPRIRLTIGEPRHEPPAFVIDRLRDTLAGVGVYPLTAGLPELRAACAAWLERRFSLRPGAVDPETMVLPVNGTREALFALAQAVIDPAARARVAMPNPFYQIYEGAALLAGAEPMYLPVSADGLPDLETVPESLWQDCELLYLCTPGNPTGAVLGLDGLGRALDLADRYGFIVASDECYSEIYAEESSPPPGLLEAAARLGRDRFERCVAFHSLSKRSNLPGLRAGFVAGDPELISRFARYRTYHGCAMPEHVQHASIAAWGDERHVVENRRLYREKFDAVLPMLADVLDVARPAGAFYLWPRVPGGDDEAFARGLLAARNVAVLPGTYLGRPVAGVNPGRGRVRISLVATTAECVEAAARIREFIEEP